MDTTRDLVVLACEVSGFSLHSCLRLWPVVGVASGGRGWELWRVCRMLSCMGGGCVGVGVIVRERAL